MDDYMNEKNEAENRDKSKTQIDVSEDMTAWKRKTSLFLSSQALSLFGSSLVQYAITWYITIKTQSGIMMTIAIICGFLPTFFLSPFAGVWADRFNRKHLIIISDSFIAISTLVLALLFMLGYQATWLLFAAMSLRAIGSGIQSPAVSAIIPRLSQEAFIKDKCAEQQRPFLCLAAIPLLSGALLSIAPIESVFFIDVVTAAIAVFFLSVFLHVPPHKKALQKTNTGYFSDLKLGVKYIWKHDFIRLFFIFCAVFFFLEAPACFLTPLQVTRKFGNNVLHLTAIEIAFSIGMLVGGLIMAAWQGFRNKIHTVAMAGFVFSLFTVVLGFIPVFPVYLIIMGILGLAMPFFNTPATVLFQQKVDPNYLGRVFGVLGMLTSSIMPLSMLLFGPLADIIKVDWIIIASGSLIFVVGLIVFFSKVLIEEGETDSLLESTAPQQFN